jgi:hypothetical protein
MSKFDHSMGRRAETDVASSNKMTVQQLDSFMQKVTDEKIVNDARNFIEGGS